MKKTIVTMLAASLSLGVFAQGTIFVDNTANTGVFGGFGGTAFTGANSGTVYSAGVTQNGLIFTLDTLAQAQNNGGPAGSQLMGVNFSYALFAGGTAGTVNTLVSTVTGSAINNGSGVNATYGGIQNPSGSSIDLTSAGIGSTATGFFRLQIWEGSTFSTYALAVAGNDFVADSGIFSQATGGGATPPKNLIGLPDMQMAVIASPEPTTLALAGLGGAALLAFRRRKA